MPRTIHNRSHRRVPILAASPRPGTCSCPCGSGRGGFHRIPSGGQRGRDRVMSGPVPAEVRPRGAPPGRRRMSNQLRVAIPRAVWRVGPEGAATPPAPLPGTPGGPQNSRRNGRLAALRSCTGRCPRPPLPGHRAAARHTESKRHHSEKAVGIGSSRPAHQCPPASG
jgi:hypothetical protein